MTLEAAEIPVSFHLATPLFDCETQTPVRSPSLIRDRLTRQQSAYIRLEFGIWKKGAVRNKKYK